MKKSKELKISCSTKDTLPIEQLHDFQGNLKSLSKDNYTKLKQSLLKFGFSFPFFVWKDSNGYKILDGHQRLKVLQGMSEEGYKIPSVPVVFVEAKDRKEAKQKLLAATSRYGVIDHEGLAEFMLEADLNLEDLPQFDFADLDNPPYGIKESSKDHSSRGKIAKATVYKRSNWDDKIPDQKAFENMFSLSKNQIIFGGNYFTEYLEPTPSWIVWNKKQTGDFADCELAWTSHKKACRLYEQTWNGMIREGESGKRVHPTQKPIALGVWCFENYGEPKTVLDLFLGSGSTLIACEKTNRKCYGMELDEHYCSVIIERWQNLTGKTARRIESNG